MKKTPNRNTQEARVPRIALISPDASFRKLVKRSLDDAAASSEWVLNTETDVGALGPESVDELVTREPTLLFIDVGMNPGPAVRFISAVTSRAPGLAVVAAGRRLEGDDLLQIVRAGASEYLQRPFDPDEVSDACFRILRRITSDPMGTEGGKARSLALFSPKGGAGVSTLATNLATQIRRVTEKKTLLVDLSPGMGSCALLLGVEPRYSHQDVVENLHRMDRSLLRSFLSEHESGLQLLASPGDARPESDLTGKDVESLVRLMQRHFDYVVVDVGRRMADPAAVNACQMADDTLVVTTPELPTLRAVKRVLPHLGAPADRAKEQTIRLVVNRYREGGGVSRKDIEEALGAPVFHMIREDGGDLSRSVNLGEPIVLNGASPYSKDVESIGNRIAGDDLLEKNDGSRLKRFFQAVLPPYGRNGKKAGRRTSSAGAEK